MEPLSSANFENFDAQAPYAGSVRSENPQTIEKPFRLAVGIATRGRPTILNGTLEMLQLQTLRPSRIVVCYTSSTDVQSDRSVPDVEFITEVAGSARQRNAILAAVDDCDAILFLDDDFLPDARYIEATVAVLKAERDVVVTTGAVISDGAKGPGLEDSAARRLLSEDRYDGSWPGVTPAFNGYGCNMAIRLSTVRANGISFDERLPLYGWYEDVDFTRRLGRHGRIVRVEAARGVHLGTKLGRTSGLRLGYSQIANPIYLLRKGTIPLYFALQSAGRHCTINLARSLWPESYIDRRGRLAGNALALFDLLRGRISPERIIDLHKA